MSRSYAPFTLGACMVVAGQINRKKLTADAKLCVCVCVCNEICVLDELSYLIIFNTRPIVRALPYRKFP
jgi:hypothetical protein